MKLANHGNSWIFDYAWRQYRLRTNSSTNERINIRHCPVSQLWGPPANSNFCKMNLKIIHPILLINTAAFSLKQKENDDVNTARRPRHIDVIPFHRPAFCCTEQSLLIDTPSARVISKNDMINIYPINLSRWCDTTGCNRFRQKMMIMDSHPPTTHHPLFDAETSDFFANSVGIGYVVYCNRNHELNRTFESTVTYRGVTESWILCRIHPNSD